MARAFISVSDKTGVVDFAKGLEAKGYEIISTGGTLKTLQDAGVNAISVTKITNFPECLDGRVKTMHPNIHAGILAMRSNPEHMRQIAELNVEPIDIVAINLYPFKATISKPDCTFEQAIENIDIGGPTAIRAAAKNWQDVFVVCDVADYSRVLDMLNSKLPLNGMKASALKRELAYKVFEHTAAYDALICNYLRQEGDFGKYPDKLTLTYEKAQDMRYGENPHQSAAFYREPLDVSGTIAGAKQIQGKEISFNNVNDTEAALSLVQDLTKLENNSREVAVVAVKHANPCGVAIGTNIYDTYLSAYNADPVSIFGGIVATNAQIDEATANEMVKIFLEIVIAPSYTPEALKVFEQKPNLRVLELPDFERKTIGVDTKKVGGGLLIQDLNTGFITECKTVTTKQPTPEGMEQLRFAYLAVKYAKSNGIVLAKDYATVGVGPGQTNRITALELALKFAGEDKARGSVMASDAFFPFSDCVETAAKAGITAIIQPGGSIRDNDSIDLCNKYGIAMIFTGMRHFRH
ncbi:MAG: bifunctional phosphoribosylaminoimidazolecarboxamide formyltransferase/IMP cyclohydrolase [Clostridiales bacterium]|jgi:phosphoribosylaminoimidazolecarboxamide formyltransferase/IMP cyclohydrolase|nr:bifunctional phosphoribosylaminoimidazolecarboxamide formyltransferase/IMP cyclohydrolase [Clostridiales bacterium]